ncbi:SycD/LcrH family type III secretion system chaperone [Pigmentiphaga aceris]|uniref:SycD/LcrH family type III secretion system chaperone n=1 Tax=Pigmentiphaga aceris TaxID=1940612 RepID=UPI00165255C3|nr:SycD/LcrH family type III secretion system chaperone [Pigmentiphaga aceris]
MSQQSQEVSTKDEEIIEGLKTALLAGGTIGPALDITEDEREAMYQLGYGFHQQGRYSEAFKAFSMLVIWDHLEPRYLVALASTCQMLGRYADALQHYMMATLISLDDPVPPFHCAECLIVLERLPEAIDSLELVLNLAGDDHPVVKARAEALLASIKTKLQ